MHHIVDFSCDMLTLTASCTERSVTSKAADWLTRDTSHNVKLSGKLYSRNGTMAVYTLLATSKGARGAKREKRENNRT